MHPAGAHLAPAGPVRPALEVADIVRRFGDELLSGHALGFEQRQALEHIALCRTARLGGHLDVCPQCGLQRPAYNSCRDRHCPKCQWLLSERWLDSRLERMLPVHHFHVVFTLPSELRLLTLYNRRPLFDLLFHTASEALKKLADDDRRLGALLGITAVLHTWSRDLNFHPHIHCVVTGGGIDADGKWAGTRPGFLFPVRVLAKLFRGIFIDALKRLAARGELRFDGKYAPITSRSEWQHFIDKLYRKRWNVYSKKPFGGIEGVHRYLAKYTHRIAISNRRLIGFDDRAVTFYTRHGKTTSLPPLAFLARFLSHVLPKNFVRIRHYGLYASASVNGRLPQARALLEQTIAPSFAPDRTVKPKTDPPDVPDYVTRYRNATGIDLRRCPKCGASIHRFALVPERAPLAPVLSRAPPNTA